MITILGAGGAIGNELVKLLAAKNQPFRLVGRNPKATPGAMRCDRSSPSTSSIRSAVKSGVFSSRRRPDVRMVEGREDLGFALKARDAIRIAND